MNKSKRMLRYFIPLLSILFLCACSSDDLRALKLTKPKVSAGDDKEVYNTQQTVWLNGSVTYPFNRKSKTILWKQTSGPLQVTIHNNEELEANFSVPTADGVYTFKLQVTDNYKQTGDDDIQITIKAAQVEQKKFASVAVDTENEIKNKQNPVDSFEFLWHSVNELHAHLARRNINWQLVYQKYSPLIHDELNQRELQGIMLQMLAELGDYNALLSTNEKVMQADRKTSSLHSYIKKSISVPVGSQPSEMQWLNPLSRFPQLNQLYQQAINNYADAQTMQQFSTLKASNKAGRNLLSWGLNSSNTGILVVNHFDYVSIKTLHQQLDTIFTQLQDSDALILDIRTNPGGENDIAMALVSHFINTQIVAFNTYSDNSYGHSDRQQTEVAPASGQKYLKPIYLLTSQDTAGAAEVFTLVMRELPQVIHLGEATQGALSETYQVQLPSGSVISIANQVVENMHGDIYEGIGIPPQQPVRAFDIKQINQGHILSYEKALQLARQYTF